MNFNQTQRMQVTFQPILFSCMFVNGEEKKRGKKNYLFFLCLVCKEQEMKGKMYLFYFYTHMNMCERDEIKSAFWEWIKSWLFTYFFIIPLLFSYFPLLFRSPTLGPTVIFVFPSMVTLLFTSLTFKIFLSLF